MNRCNRTTDSATSSVNQPGKRRKPLGMWKFVSNYVPPAEKSAYYIVRHDAIGACFLKTEKNKKSLHHAKTYKPLETNKKKKKQRLQDVCMVRFFYFSSQYDNDNRISYCSSVCKIYIKKKPAAS